MYESLITSRTETHVLLAIKNKASHWLAIWTVSCTLTYCERRQKRELSVKNPHSAK